jgi:hypothetical protein
VRVIAAVMTKEDPVAFVVAAFRGRGRGRSKLYSWMVDHYEELARAKAGGARVDWVSVTAEMAALGFKARGDHALKPDAVRRTWQRVEADRASGKIRAPVRARLENFDPKRDVPFPVEALRKDDDDFEIHDVMGRPIK